MSDSEDSTVTYTTVSIPFEDGSDIGSPGVDGPPIMPEDPYAYIMAAYQVPPSPYYIPGPKVPPSPDYIPGPEEPQSHPPLDFPLLAAASPTADSPGYVLESDPEEEPEEDDKDPEEDLADYPVIRDDDDDDNDEDEDEDKEEEEEHPAPTNSVPPVHRMTARISIRDEPSISLPPREEVERLLVLTTPPPSPLTPLSSPLPHIPSPPFPASLPASPIRLLGYRAAMIRPRAETPSTSHPLPLPTSSPLLYELGESSAAATTRPIKGRRIDYGFVGTMDTEIRRQRAEEVGYRIRDVVRSETTIHYERLKMAREAWGLSMDASDYARSDVMSLRTTVVAHSTLISELQSADHSRQRTTDTDGRVLEAAWGPGKSAAQPRCTRRLVAVPRIGYIHHVSEPEHKMAPKKNYHEVKPQMQHQHQSQHSYHNTVTNAQIQAMINEGVTAALAARDATRNGDDSHTSGTGARRPVHSMPVNMQRVPSQEKLLTWGEIKKLEFEMWNLKVKGNDVVTYSQRFQELALMCDRMFPEEIDQVEKYVGGLPDTIHGSVMATKPKTMQDAIDFLSLNSGQKINTWAEHQLTTKESLMTPLGATRISNQTRDKTLEELIPQEMVIGDHTEGLNLCVPNLTITKKGSLMLPNGHSATDLVN
ncbi:hypothetical protein Tco_0369294 [Tanacetum coccineum]